MTMNDLMRSVKFTGGIGVVGVFVPEDPAPQDKLYKQGEIVFTMACSGSKVSGSVPASVTSRRIIAYCAT
ncbi:hypothetical protein [Sphingomonas yunnanensis]|uniref:hypothetical protein n=1 Tax=Sphingomonas yunnanensis TaxID=310400 RepID=UPI001FE519B3|nr:hypothetical protein [Sphingomonas yunnanensis]